MTSQEKPPNTESIRENTRQTVERGANIQEEVRDITLKALREGDLDPDRIKKVVRSVIEGASGAAEHGFDRERPAMRETLAGLEEALAKVAIASGLAIEETVGKLEEFTEHDVKRGLEELKTLEGLFLEVLRDHAANATGLAKEVFHDAVAHGQRSGTSIGTEVDRALGKAGEAIKKSGRAAPIAGAQAAKGIAAQLARVASGILGGLADALQATEKGDKPRS